MSRADNLSESVSVFARFRPSKQDDSHITIFEENTNLTSKLDLKSQERLREAQLCLQFHF